VLGPGSVGTAGVETVVAGVVTLGAEVGAVGVVSAGMGDVVAVGMLLSEGNAEAFGETSLLVGAGAALLVLPAPSVELTAALLLELLDPVPAPASVPHPQPRASGKSHAICSPRKPRPRRGAALPAGRACGAGWVWAEFEFGRIGAQPSASEGGFAACRSARE
jgi:hypothetical protein